MNRSITYNISYGTMSDELWLKLKEVYASLPGWLGYDDSECPCWFGKSELDQEHLWASIEPSGLLVGGTVNDEKWNEWSTQFITKASEALGVQVCDAEG